MSIANLLSPNPKPWLNVNVNSVQLTSSGGVPSDLNYYEEYSQTNTFSGPWGATTYDRLVRVTRIGNIVTLKIDAIFQPSSAMSPISSSQLLPSRFRPIGSADGSSYIQSCVLVNNSTASQGFVAITNGGQILIEFLNTAGPFPLSFGNSSGIGNAGFPDLALTYMVA